MSKSKGNVIDPLEVMDGCDLEVLLQKLYDSNLSENEIKKNVVARKKDFPSGIPECGTDALRFAMLSYMVQSSINLDVKRVVGYREFGNKLWNIVKFALGNFPSDWKPKLQKVRAFEESKLTLADKWILSRCDKLINSTNQHFIDYKFGDMANGLYDFWKKDLADVYLEAIKPTVKNGDCEATLNTLYFVLDQSLKLLHPTMPYITEELYQRLPHLPEHKSESICIAPYPSSTFGVEPEVEVNMDRLMMTVRAIRQQLASYQVPPKARPTVYIRAPNDMALFKAEAIVVAALAKTGVIIVLSATDAEPEGCLKGFVTDDISNYVKVAGIVDIKLELQRIAKKQAQIEKIRDQLQAKLNAPAYMERTPENVRKQNDEKIAGYQTELADMQKQMETLSKL